MVLAVHSRERLIVREDLLVMESVSFQNNRILFLRDLKDSGRKEFQQEMGSLSVEVV